MAAQTGVFYYLVSGVILALLGTLAHIARAVFNVLPDRLSDRPMMDLLVSDGYDLSDMLWGTEYDDAGYYRLDSLKNLRISVTLTVVGGWAMMLLTPGMSALVAGAIDSMFQWTWELFLFRLREAGLL